MNQPRIFLYFILVAEKTGFRPYQYGVDSPLNRGRIALLAKDDFVGTGQSEENNTCPPECNRKFRCNEKVYCFDGEIERKRLYEGDEIISEEIMGDV
ncbi:hypothetical protein OAN24_00825 [Pseudodesulfovibrio sp.]|nr:hypothetical protein [Pseudodesulfovibrio sp.]